MQDISKFSEEVLSSLSSMYINAKDNFKINIASSSLNNQKKLSKWIAKTCPIEMYSLPEEILEIFSAKNDSELFEFLKICHEQNILYIKKKEKSFDDLCVNFTPEIKSALRHFLDMEYMSLLTTNDNTLKITVEDTPAYIRTLTLKNADGYKALTNANCGYYMNELNMDFLKEENRYRFYGKFEDLEDGSDKSFQITFEACETDVQVFNAMEDSTTWSDPWEIIVGAAYAIVMKSELPGAYCSPMEISLLPLMKELSELQGIDITHNAPKPFPLLKNISERYGHKKMSDLITKLEKTSPAEFAYHNISQKLHHEICLKKYEPMWREIYSKITESQKEYPLKAELFCPPDLLTKTRTEIQSLMESHGYTGTYPDFFKAGKLKGIHLETSYNMTYFVGMEKHAEYYIHCFESFSENNALTVGFLCGAAFLKKSEKTEDIDIYSCLFNAKGKRISHFMNCSISLEEADINNKSNIETWVTIAVKKAECRRLNKKEKKEYYGLFIPGFKFSLGMFLGMFIIGGGMFGILMTLFCMITCIITSIIAGSFTTLSELMSSVPWGVILAIGWIGFGGIMGILEVMARRK